MEALSKKAEEIGIMDGSLTQIAFNEILGNIYINSISEEKLDKLIEDIADILMEKLGVSEDKINWQMIEEWHYKEYSKLLEFEIYLDFKEAIKIISKSKVSSDYDWEDISSSAMQIDKINEKMISEFKETVELNGLDYLQKYIEKSK